SPFAAEPAPSVDAATSPKIIIPKNSTLPKAVAARASSGAASPTTTTAMQEPTKEATAVINSATPALPAWAIGNPSRHVITEEALPGRLRRMEAVDPPYWPP